MQVNCYDVVGDTDSRTESNLRTKFEWASTPGILLLRHVEALSAKGCVSGRCVLLISSFERRHKEY